MKSFKNNNIYLLVVFFSSIILVACDKDQTPQERPAPGVIVTTASIQLVKETSEFIGRTEAINDVKLRARVQGYLLERSFSEGDNVEVGDVLYTIESDTYKATVAAAQGNVERANAEVARTDYRPK